MVQGIGFRYTTQRFAADLGLVGWVRNLKDGRVEVLAEGPQKDLEKFMEKLADHFGAYIKGKAVNYQPSEGTFKNFQIVR